MKHGNSNFDAAVITVLRHVADQRWKIREIRQHYWKTGCHRETEAESWPMPLSLFSVNMRTFAWLDLLDQPERYLLGRSTSGGMAWSEKWFVKFLQISVIMDLILIVPLFLTTQKSEKMSSTLSNKTVKSRLLRKIKKLWRSFFSVWSAAKVCNQIIL